MKMTTFLTAAATAMLLASTPLLAQEIMIEDSYIRSSTPTAPTGAAFFVMMNHSEQDDRLVSVASEVAEKVELHRHSEDANGVMRMGQIEGGVALAAGESHAFERGGDHVMFMGLNRPLEQGSAVTVTLTFEKAGDVVIEVPVDHERRPDHGAMKH